MAGLLAATKGGFFDGTMGRIADVIMSIPSLIFALLMLSIFGGSLAAPSTSFWLHVRICPGRGGAVPHGGGVFGAQLGGRRRNCRRCRLCLCAGGHDHLFDASEIILILVVAIIYSPRVFRLTRAVAGNVVVMDYIEAAQAAR